MKPLMLIPALLIGLLAARAQCHNAYFPMSDGVKFEQTSYNAKDKEEGKTVSIVSSSNDEKVIVKNEIYDKKGELITSGDYEVICEGEQIKIDIEQFIPDELLSNYQNMEVIIEGDFLEFPNDLNVGQNLPDGNGKIEIKMGDGAVNMVTTITLTFTNRKVELQESLTTPAGTFETYKISQTTISEMEIMGISRETSVTSSNWIAKGVGTVKSENYDKKGKLIGYSLLTSFSK